MDEILHSMGVLFAVLAAVWVVDLLFGLLTELGGPPSESLRQRRQRKQEEAQLQEFRKKWSAINKALK